VRKSGVPVLEAESIGWGASGRSGGQVIVGWGCEQAKLASLVGPDDARMLFDWSKEAVALVHQRARTFTRAVKSSGLAVARR